MKAVLVEGEEEKSKTKGGRRLEWLKKKRVVSKVRGSGCSGFGSPKIKSWGPACLLASGEEDSGRKKSTWGGRRLVFLLEEVYGKKFKTSGSGAAGPFFFFF